MATFIRFNLKNYPVSVDKVREKWIAKFGSKSLQSIVSLCHTIDSYPRALWHLSLVVTDLLTDRLSDHCLIPRPSSLCRRKRILQSLNRHPMMTQLSMRRIVTESLSQTVSDQADRLLVDRV